MENLSQTEHIRKHLEAGKNITALDAFYQFNCLRLAARIKELKKDGLAICSRTVELEGKHFSQYSLAKILIVGLILFSSCTTLKPGCAHQRHNVRMAQLEQQYEHSRPDIEDWTRRYRNQYQRPHRMMKLPFINAYIY